MVYSSIILVFFNFFLYSYLVFSEDLRIFHYIYSRELMLFDVTVNFLNWFLILIILLIYRKSVDTCILTFYPVFAKLTF